MQETINLLHNTIDEERSQLVMADRLKDDLLNQVLGLQSQYNLRKEKVEKLEIELKSLYANRMDRMGGETLSAKAADYSQHGHSELLNKITGSIKK